MKKIISFLFVFVMCFALFSCDPGTYVVQPEVLTGVESVELIEYTNSKQKYFKTWVPDQFDDLIPFEVANATVLERLPEERIQEFKDAFMQTHILHTYYAYNSPSDVCIRLNYENGNFLIIWANYKRNSFGGYIGQYAADGTVLSFWGSFSGLMYYEDLVNNFFAYKI